MKNKVLLFVAAVALVGNASVFAATPASKHQKKSKPATTINARTQALETEVRSLKKEVAGLQKAKKQGSDILGSLAEVYAHGPAVVTSPALGLRGSAEDASDLMVNLPSMNEDLQILRTRQKMDNYALSHNISIPQRPIIMLSGGGEGQISNIRAYSGKKTADVDLTKAELDVIGEASPWATVGMIISFDNGGINGLPDRVSNSRLYLSRGFLTIGQLNKFPMYFTMGQIYMPFGRYSSYRVTTASTQILGRIRQRAGVLGFDYAGLYGQVYGFPGETHVNGNVELAKRGGLNLGYKHIVNDRIMFDVGAGVTGNIAESQGMLNNGQSDSNYFKGFDSGKTIKSRVPGVDGYAKFNFKPITLVGEYVAATKSFDAVDMTFDGKGAKPMALDLEAAYEFKLWNKPNNFAIGYGQSWEALAINIPKRDLFAEYNVSIWKDTIESLEFRHNINYNAGDYATGNNGTVKITPPGKISNSITFQLGIYF